MLHGTLRKLFCEVASPCQATNLETPPFGQDRAFVPGSGEGSIRSARFFSLLSALGWRPEVAGARG